MNDEEAQARAEMAAIGRELGARGLAIGTAGNLSMRLSDGYLVSPTNAALSALDPARIAKLDADWRHLAGDAPTKEIAMHRAMFETRAASQAIVHLHSTHAVAVSCLADVPRLDPMPIFSPYFVMRVGHLPVLPYFPPGSDAIGEAIRALGGKYASVLLANHGPVLAGASLRQALHAAEELEETARLFLLLQNRPIRVLTEAEIAELVRRFALDW